MLTKQEPFNQRGAKCSTPLHGSISTARSSLVPLSSVRPPSSIHSLTLSHTHTYTHHDFLPVKHATEAKLFFLRIYNPKGSSRKRRQKELFINPRAVAGSTQDGHHSAFHSPEETGGVSAGWHQIHLDGIRTWTCGLGPGLSGIKSIFKEQLNHQAVWWKHTFKPRIIMAQDTSEIIKSA